MMYVHPQGKPITALTWGHNNKRLFVAAGCYIFTAWVTKQVAMLQYLCRRAIHCMLKDDSQLDQLPLPSKLSTAVASLFVPTIKVCSFALNKNIFGFDRIYSNSCTFTSYPQSQKKSKYEPQ